jgi:hypothetical protein
MGRRPGNSIERSVGCVGRHGNVNSRGRYLFVLIVLREGLCKSPG